MGRVVALHHHHVLGVAQQHPAGDLVHSLFPAGQHLVQPRDVANSCLPVQPFQQILSFEDARQGAVLLNHGTQLHRVVI